MNLYPMEHVEILFKIHDLDAESILKSYEFNVVYFKRRILWQKINLD